MKRYLITLAGFVRRLFTGRESTVIHRQIALVCPSRISGDEILSRLQACTFGDLPPLQEDSFLAAGALPPAQADSTANTTHRVMIFVGADRHRRLRRWRFRLCDGTAETPADASGGERIDTMIVCWSYSQLTSPHIDEPTLPAMTARLTQLAANHRSLRRCAIIVTGAPVGEGLYHPVQSRLDLPRHQGWRDGINFVLDHAVNAPGNGLADPRWRRFVSGQLAGCKELAVLFETLRHAVGDECPLFFLPERVDPTASQSLVEWISTKRRQRTRVSVRATRIAWQFAGLATGCLIGALALALCLPQPEPRPLDLRTLSREEQVSAAVQRHLEYDAALNRRVRLIAFGDIPAISDSIANIALILRIRADRDRICRLTDSLVASPASVVGRRRDSTVITLAGALAAQFDSVTVYQNAPARHEWEVLRCAQLSLLQQKIIRTAIILSFASCQIDSTNPLHVRVLVERDRLIKPTESWESIPGLPYLQAVRQARRLPDLYSLADAIAADSRYSIPDTLLSRLLPPLPLAELAAHFLSSDFAKVMRTRQDTLLSQLTALVESNSIAQHNASSLGLTAAKAALFAWAGLQKPSDLVIGFIRVGDQDWHVDVSLADRLAYRPARWQERSTEVACLARIEEWSPGQALSIRCNSRTALHTVAGSADLPCVRDAAINLCVNDTTGTIQFPNDGFTITYRIMSGWPKWPPEPEALAKRE